jgi:threonine synthase
VLAHNANRTVPDFLKTGDWRPRPSVPTLASAMDVGAPSNMERLCALFPDTDAVRGAVRAESVSDTEIQARIKSDFHDYGKVWCPHTATAAEVYARMSPGERADARWIMVSTAHPAKFREIVEPLIGQRIEMPESLAKLFSRPVSATELQPDLAALTRALDTTVSKI